MDKVLEKVPPAELGKVHALKGCNHSVTGCTPGSCGFVGRRLTILPFCMKY